MIIIFVVCRSNHKNIIFSHFIHSIYVGYGIIESHWGWGYAIYSLALKSNILCIFFNKPLISAVSFEINIYLN